MKQIKQVFFEMWDSDFKDHKCKSDKTKYSLNENSVGNNHIVWF